MGNLTTEQKEEIKNYAQVYEEILEYEGSFTQNHIQQDWYESVRNNLDFIDEDNEDEACLFFKEEKEKAFETWLKELKEKIEKENMELDEDWDHNNYENIYTFKAILPKDAVEVCWFNNRTPNCLDTSDINFIEGQVYWSDIEDDYFVKVSEYVPNTISGGWCRVMNVYKFDDKFDNDFREKYNISSFNEDFREYFLH